MRAKAGRWEVQPEDARSAEKRKFWGGVIFVVLVIGVIVVVVLSTQWDADAGRGSITPKDLDTAGFPKGKSFIDYAEPGERLAFWDVEERPSTGERDVTITKRPDADGKDMVVKQHCDRDGRFYYVSASLPDKMQAARKLAEVRRRTDVLLHTLVRYLDGGKRLYARDGVEVTRNMAKLVGAHRGKETPLAEYHNPGDRTVGSNCDKGKLIEVCLRHKTVTSRWNSDNTIFRVHVHELAHSADFHVREDGHKAHGPDFYRLQTYLLMVSQELGIYSKEEYAASGGDFCGLRFSEKDAF